MSVILNRLCEGFVINCQLFGLTLLFSIPLGLLICFGSMSRFKPLSWLVKTFVWIIRGTPLMLQLLIIFNGPGLMNLGNPWSAISNGRLVAAVVAFVINYACYFAEIFRGGIQSVPVGQQEAGLVLGMTKRQIEKELIRQATLFEENCKLGNVSVERYTFRSTPSMHSK